MSKPESYLAPLVIVLGMGTALILTIMAMSGEQLELELNKPTATPTPTPEPELPPDQVECSNCGNPYAGYLNVCPKCGIDNPWK